MSGNVVTLTDVEDEQRRASLKINKQAEDLNNEAMRLKLARKYNTAYIAQQRAVNLCPESGFLHNGLASILWNLGRYEDAYASAQTAMRLLGPEDPSSWVNYGMMLSSLGRKDEAHDYLRRAAETMPDNAHAQWSYAMTLLEHGDWERGFKQYECRPNFRGKKYYPNMPYPMWKGEDLNGKTLYIQSEQGIGDRILFSRYLAWVKETWPKSHIKFLAGSPDLPHLEALLWNYHTDLGIEFLHPQIPWPEADYGCFMMSLAAIRGTTPDNVPPDPGYIRKRILPEADQIEVPSPLSPAIKVGICWTGNPIMVRNEERSVPPQLMFELECDPLVQLYSLQFNRPDFADHDVGEIICNAAADIDDRGYCGTAAVMLNLDMVITCCTVHAHLAGALGIPTWVLLCNDPYWVWLRKRDDSPWYPSVRLFRQERPGEWRPVIERVKRELHAFAERLLKQRSEAVIKEQSYG